MKKNLFLALSATLLFASCKKDDTVDPPPAPANPTIAAISPASGPRAITVRISGANFGTNTAALKVYFNTTEASIQSLNDTLITVTVPAAATTGAVNVEKNSTTITGPVFTRLTGNVVVTLAGGSGAGFADGPLADARFSSPTNLVRDAAGNIYVTDRDNARIRKITPAGIVSTLAGGPSFDWVDGTGTAARFYSPYGLAIDGSGNLFVGEYHNQTIRKVTPAGVVTTLAGNPGQPGYLDGTGLTAQFNQPVGPVVDGSGNVFVADYLNNRIRKITPAGVVTTFAGSGTGALVNGTGTAASFQGPFALAFYTSGNMAVADYLNHTIRTVTPGGVVTTLAGNGTSGFADGTGSAARFNRPAQMVIDPGGTIYVCDALNNRIRKVTSSGDVFTVAGNGTSGFADGPGSSATFNYPMGICADFTNGILYVTDFNTSRIRMIVLDL